MYKIWFGFLILLALFGFDHLESEQPIIEKVDLKLEQNELGVTFIDLTSGEAILIQHGTGKNVLINTGGPKSDRELYDTLKMFDVSSLDAVIITSANEQYTGNLIELKEKLNVKKFITGEHILLNSSLNQIKVVDHWGIWKKNESYEILPGLKVQVLHENYNESNLQGMDLRLIFHHHQWLLMSSSNEQVEKQLMKKDLQEINLLKVAHFGQGTGSTKEFLDYLNPQVAIIFRKNDEWPSQDVMERLYQSWMDIYPLKQFGSISIKLNENKYEVIPIAFENR
ncbi:ComEC/Rec2 family competence protein [Bacillus kexueae]|uniref:ComEC/Rec2 family competence protein n=1 Tax=Aeribacillus kexueae TaxID=2078952 RepID=UPI001FAF2C1B|nr:hypothetical protein [Bacillus kexueae]